ncbi:MAG: tetratricopeptide repeat protein, partial [Phycisphaerae bacterium]
MITSAHTIRTTKTGYRPRPNVWLVPLVSLKRHHPLLTSLAFAILFLWLLVTTICGPDDMDVKRAALAINSGRYERAATLLQAELIKHPDNSAAARQLVESLIMLGDLPGARRMLDPLEPFPLTDRPAGQRTLSADTLPIRINLLLAELHAFAEVGYDDIGTSFHECAVLLPLLRDSSSIDWQARGHLLSAYLHEAARATDEASVEGTFIGKGICYLYVRFE